MNINEKIQELEKQLEELKKEIAKQDKKEHKSLSDYRCYRIPNFEEDIKVITTTNEIIECATWYGNTCDLKHLNCGNVYSIDTPNELLERELKKRQLWFALEKHLKENNCLATNEDWKDTSKVKFCMFYDYDDKRYYIEDSYYSKQNTIYSTDKEVLENYMNTLSEEDIKIMFDVD